MLPKFCSCAVALSEKFVYALSRSCNIVHVAYFPACCSVSNLMRIDCYDSSYVLYLYMSLYKVNDLISFLSSFSISSFLCTLISSFLCTLISSFRCTVAPSKFSWYCSLVLRCGEQFRGFCVLFRCCSRIFR